MISQGIGFLLSIIGVIGLWNAGNKTRKGWLFLMVQELGWVGWSISIHEYGLLVGCLVWFLCYVRNYRKWTN